LPLAQWHIAVPGNMQRKQELRNHLVGKGFGRRYRDLRACMQVNTAIDSTGDSRPDHIDQTQGMDAATFKLFDASQGVGRLARLRNK
jgi:hypothetical protein